MNNEFLRPRVNSCKWFNDLSVMRKCVYIEKGGKCKISAKNNRVNRFTYYLNRFKQLNDKPNEQWRLKRIRHKLNRFKSPQMKIDTIQTLMNRFKQSQRVLWYDSLTFESIQARKKWKIDNDNIWIDSRKLWINSMWIDSQKLWIDSLRYYSGKFDSIQKEWHTENGQKECLTWINESWIESRNSRKDFPYMITHKTSWNHMTQWDMVC